MKEVKMKKSRAFLILFLAIGILLPLTAGQINSSSSDLQLFPQVVARTGGYMFCWDDNRDDQFEIYARPSDATPTPSGSDKGVSPHNDDGHTMTCRMVPSGSDAIVAWTERINIFEKILANDIILNSVLEGYKKVKLTLVG
jgi:hypothetical protein